MFVLPPVQRRIAYVASFEIIAIILSTILLMMLSDGHAENSLPVAIVVSAIAVSWNFVFNTVFEAWERRAHITERTVFVRVAHAIGFEGGLFLFTVPLYMLWYGVGLWKAFTMEAALLLFFLIFTFVFTWAFDLVFMLPQKASEPRDHSADRLQDCPDSSGLVP